MNTPQDRANRIAGWSTRGRDLFWIMSMLVVVNLVILLLIGAGYDTTFIPATDSFACLSFATPPSSRRSAAATSRRLVCSMAV